MVFEVRHKRIFAAVFSVDTCTGFGLVPVDGRCLCGTRIIRVRVRCVRSAEGFFVYIRTTKVLQGPSPTTILLRLLPPPVWMLDGF